MGASEELQRFAADLGKIASGALPEVDAVLKKGAQNIKNDLQAGARSSSLRGVVPSISYDSQYGVGVARYEIGPDIDRNGGALGHIYYLGTSRGGGTGDLEGPLLRETPNLESHMGKVADGWANRL